jgi:hypothetical protein
MRCFNTYILKQIDVLEYDTLPNNLYWNTLPVCEYTMKSVPGIKPSTWTTELPHGVRHKVWPLEIFLYLVIIKLSWLNSYSFQKCWFS